MFTFISLESDRRIFKMAKKIIKTTNTVKKPRNPKPVVKSPGTSISTAKTYQGKSLAPGGGGRFEKLKDKIVSSGKTPTVAASIAASVGRKKYGAKKMADWSSQGKKRSK